VAVDASLPHSYSVATVVKAHIKALERRERFDRSRLPVRVTDVADVAAGVIHLLRVASSTGRMARQFGLRRTRLAPVAEQTSQARVRSVAVRKDGKIALRLDRGKLIRGV
jgi:hypothetical protein